MQDVEDVEDVGVELLYKARPTAVYNYSVCVSLCIHVCLCACTLYVSLCLCV